MLINKWVQVLKRQDRSIEAILARTYQSDIRIEGLNIWGEGIYGFNGRSLC